MSRPLSCLTAAAAITASIAQPASNTNNCNLYGPGVTYIGSSLYQPTADYVVRDKYNYEVMNYTYTFNICGNVVNPPQQCVGQPSAPAYQWINGTNTCTYIGGRVDNNKFTPQTSLLDPLNPANGFVMTYINGNGDSCPDGAPRTFTVGLQCGRYSLPPPSSNFLEFWVEEFNQCQYQVNLFASQGCPQECPKGPNGLLCTDNGLCGYDKNLNGGLGGGRCFCDDDYMDADCSNPRNPLPTGAIAGATIGGILAGLIAVFGYSYYKARRGSGNSVDGFYGQVA